MEKHLEPKSLSFEYGGKEITLETGRIARQATAAVLVTVDQTQVLTTVVAKKEADPGKDFFPLACLLYTSPSPRDLVISRMPSSA